METLLAAQETAKQLMREKDGAGAVAAVERVLADFDAQADVLNENKGKEMKTMISTVSHNRPNDPHFWTTAAGAPAAAPRPAFLPAPATSSSYAAPRGVWSALF